MYGLEMSILDWLIFGMLDNLKWIFHCVLWKSFPTWMLKVVSSGQQDLDCNFPLIGSLVKFLDCWNFLDLWNDRCLKWLFQIYWSLKCLMYVPNWRISGMTSSDWRITKGFDNSKDYFFIIDLWNFWWLEMPISYWRSLKWPMSIPDWQISETNASWNECFRLTDLWNV